jgi:hypothetical protein
VDSLFPDERPPPKARANHVAAYVDRCRELGVDPPKRVRGVLAKAVDELVAEGQPDDHIAAGVRLLADKGLRPSDLPFALVQAARRQERAALAEFVAEHGWPTGAAFVRGSHSGTCVYHPLGTDRPPDSWPYPRPSREEVEPVVSALASIGAFLSA